MATTMRATSKPNGVRSYTHQTIATCVLSLTALSAGATDWNFSPRIDLSERYTSNLNLSDANEESSFISEVAPGFSLNRQGSRVQANVNYNLRYLDYSSSQGDDDVRHNLSAAVTSELIKHHFFVDTDANISQRFLSTDDASGTGADYIGSNTTQTYTFRINPYWQQRIGDDASLTVGATYSYVDYDSNAATSSSGVNYQVSFDMEPKGSKFFWGVGFDQSQNNPDGSGSSTASDTNTFIGYHFTNQLSGRFTYGYVDNDIENASDDNANSGEYWGIEADWQPSSLTNINASYNSRLSTNSNYGFSLQRKLRSGRFVVNYTEGISNIQQTLLNPSTGTLVRNTVTDEVTLTTDPAYVLQPDEEFLPGSISFLTPSLVNDNYINKSLTSTLYLTRSKSTYNVTVFHRQRSYQSGAIGTEEDFGMTLGWKVQLNRLLTSNLNYSWSEIEPDSTSESDTLNSISWSLNRRLSRDTNISMAIDYSMRESETASREFDQYGVGLNFSHNF